MNFDFYKKINIDRYLFYELLITTIIQGNIKLLNNRLIMFEKYFTKGIILFLILQFPLHNIFGQANTNFKSGYHYIVKIVDYQKKKVSRGALYKVTDSSVIIISEIEYFNFKNNLSFKKTEIAIKEIDKIKISREYHFSTSLGIGIATGDRKSVV